MLNSLMVFVGLVALGPTGPTPEIGPEQFEGWFRNAQLGHLEIPPAVGRKGRGYRYVFVGGFQHERMPGYFAPNIAELKALGVPKTSIHVLNPSSFQTLEQNAEAVRSRFVELAGQGPERLVIIAHSRGACDALAFAIDQPDFIRDRVEALFLIQGPFGGSAAADHAVGRGRLMDRRMWISHRVLATIASRVVRWISRPTGPQVLEEMTRSNSKDFWSKTIQDHASAVAIVGPRTFYIRSKVEPSRLRFFRRAIARYLEIQQGPGDGVVGLNDQMLPDLGSTIGTLEAGHGDLTHRFPINRSARRSRRALIQSILMAVGQSPLEGSGGADLDADRLEHPVPEGQPGLERDLGRVPGVSPSRGIVAASR